MESKHRRPPDVCWEDDVRTPRDTKRIWKHSVAINRKAFLDGQSAGCVEDFYVWDSEDELGSGSFGCVYRARSIVDPGLDVAVKQIHRSGVTDMEKLKTEIAVLHALDHPNILRLYETFSDRKNIYLVMEICHGGDLMERLMRTNVEEEEFVASVTRQICGALVHCHRQGVCHRDLKCENVLLLRPGNDSPVKVADFGLAKMVSPDDSRGYITPKRKPPLEHADKPRRSTRARKKAKDALEECRARTERRCSRQRLVRMMTFAGTPEYMAPEVIHVLNQGLKQGADMYYDQRCDIWSMGVIAFMLLTGEPPYSLEDVSAFVAEGMPLRDVFGSTLDFMTASTLPDDVNQYIISTLSEDAVGFVKQCLEPKFQDRPLAEHLVSQPFLIKGRVGRKNSREAVVDVAAKMSHFAGLTRFKRAALTAAVRHLKVYELEELRQKFEDVDVDNSGTITLEELKSFLCLHLADSAAIQECSHLAEELMKQLDTDVSGDVDYTEFLAAIMDSQLEAREELAWGAFRSFDKDGDGFITRFELDAILGDKAIHSMLKDLLEENCMPFSSEADAKALVMQADLDGDGMISFEEFLNLLTIG